MRSPMILPWIARRNGLTIEHAEALWQQTVKTADARFGASRNTSEYWAFTIDDFLRRARAGRIEPPARRSGDFAWQPATGGSSGKLACFESARPPFEGSIGLTFLRRIADETC